MAKFFISKARYSTSKAFNKKSHYSDYERLCDEYFRKTESKEVDRYNKRLRKPKRLPKLIANAIVVATIASFVVILSTLCAVFAGYGSDAGPRPDASDNPHGFVGLEQRPDGGAPIDLTGFDGAKAQAAELYRIGQEKMTDAKRLVAYDRALFALKIGAANNYIDIDAVTLKTQDEYFNIEYHLKNSVPLLDSPIGALIAKAADIVTTTRTYASASMRTMKFQKVKNNAYGADGVPTAKWTDETGSYASPIKDLPQINFNSKQKSSGLFRLIKHTVTEETIKTAEVTHDDENGYWSVKASLDASNPETTKDSIEDFRKSARSDRAGYTKIDLSFTVWDNGCLRSMDVSEKCLAKVIISLDFTVESKWKCSYDARDCDFRRYPDAKSAKKALGK